MSLFDDSRLKDYQSKYERLVDDQTNYSKELARLRMRMDADLENITRSYRRELEAAERGLEATTRMIPDAARQLKRRQEELTQEMRRSAANLNSKPEGRRAA